MEFKYIEVEINNIWLRNVQLNFYWMKSNFLSFLMCLKQSRNKKKFICGVSSRFYGLYPKDLTILKAFWGLQKELSVTDFFIQVPVIFTLAHP